MQMPVVSRWFRQLSGRGALDNVTEVLVQRAAVTARLDALAARMEPVPLPAIVADAA